jgi:hypothetical protein
VSGCARRRKEATIVRARGQLAALGVFDAVIRRVIMRVMTFLRCLSVVACVAFVACGGSASTNGETSPSGAPGAAGTSGSPGAGGSAAAPSAIGQGPDICVGVGTGAASCEAPVDVATVDALLDAMIAAKPFDQSVVGAAPASSQQPSRDVRVTGALTVDVDAFRAKAPRCPTAVDAGAGGGCSETLFAQEKTFQVIRTIYGSFGDAFAPGVTCLEQEAGVAGTAGCRRVSIAAGSVVRFQMVREENHFAASTKNYLRIVRPCTDPCADGETRCAASNLCVKSGPDFCILCEGKSELACACRAGCQLAVDGAQCGASTSEDTVIGGTCHAGSCAK